MNEKIDFEKFDLHDSVVTSIAFNFNENSCSFRVHLHEILKKKHKLDYDILTICFQDIIAMDFDKWLTYSFDSFEIMEITNKYTEKCMEVSMGLLGWKDNSGENLYWNVSLKCKNVELKKESRMENGNEIKK